MSLLPPGVPSLLLGLLLLGVNLIGLFRYHTIDSDTPHLLDQRPRTISETQFWAQASRSALESELQYTLRLTEMVNDRMLLIEPRYTRPGFFENWLLWAVSGLVGHYEWVDSRRSVRMGGGYCSAHAMVLNTVLRENRLNSRIWNLDGHVVNEVMIDGQWQVFDADYNVHFDSPMKNVVLDGERVYAAYRTAGRPEASARHWQFVYTSVAGHRAYDTAQSFARKTELVERPAIWLIWLLPAALVLVGARRLWVVRAKQCV